MLPTHKQQQQQVPKGGRVARVRPYDGMFRASKVAPVPVQHVGAFDEFSSGDAVDRDGYLRCGVIGDGVADFSAGDMSFYLQTGGVKREGIHSKHVSLPNLNGPLSGLDYGARITGNSATVSTYVRGWGVPVYFVRKPRGLYDPRVIVPVSPVENFLRGFDGECDDVGGDILEEVVIAEEVVSDGADGVCGDVVLAFEGFPENRFSISYALAVVGCTDGVAMNAVDGGLTVECAKKRAIEAVVDLPDTGDPFALGFCYLLFFEQLDFQKRLVEEIGPFLTPESYHYLSGVRNLPLSKRLITFRQDGNSLHLSFKPGRRFVHADRLWSSLVWDYGSMRLSRRVRLVNFLTWDGGTPWRFKIFAPTDLLVRRRCNFFAFSNSEVEVLRAIGRRLGQYPDGSWHGLCFASTVCSGQGITNADGSVVFVRLDPTGYRGVYDGCVRVCIAMTRNMENGFCYATMSDCEDLLSEFIEGLRGLEYG